MNYRKSNRLSGILLLAGIAVALLLFCFDKVNVLFVITAAASLALICIGVLIKVMFYRCAHCHSLLPFRTIAVPEYCPYCGERLDQ